MTDDDPQRSSPGASIGAPGRGIDLQAWEGRAVPRARRSATKVGTRRAAIDAEAPRRSSFPWQVEPRRRARWGSAAVHVT